MTTTKSFLTRLTGAGFAIADLFAERMGGADEHIELHLSPKQIAALRDGCAVGEWLDAERAAQADGRGAYAVFGPLVIYRAAPRPRASNELETHQQRLMLEAFELRDRLVMLQAFITSPRFTALVTTYEQALMREQAQHMAALLLSLQKRMALFLRDVEAERSAVTVDLPQLAGSAA